MKSFPSVSQSQLCVSLLLPSQCVSNGERKWRETHEREGKTEKPRIGIRDELCVGWLALIINVYLSQSCNQDENKR